MDRHTRELHALEMSSPNTLSASIKKLIAEAPKSYRVTPTAEQLADDARDALECIETVMHAITDAVRAQHTERGFLGLQLLRASCDHGRAMMFLLAHNPLDMMGSALALHRAQIENFLRGVFYGAIATDAELADFLENDQGPRRLNPNNKWQKIPIGELATAVQEQVNRIEVAPVETGKLARMVDNAWSPLCGMVHGGVAIHTLYADGQRQIGCSVPAPVYYETTVNAVAIVNFSLTMSCTMAGIGREEDVDALEPALIRFHKFVQQHNARLRQVGLSNMQRRIGE